MMKTLYWLVTTGCLLTVTAAAQEHVAPLDHNSATPRKAVFNHTAKTTSISIPFFEDFLNKETYPSPARWVDADVYINNTMGVDVVSRGVATFDALNERSGPYDSVNYNTYRYADSLTSQPIDLTTTSPADSVYLSFFYQPQGMGFMPEVQDSLMLYLRKANGSWNKVWAKEGSAVQPFEQVMIAVADPDYFWTDFQFRFVNKASINLNDDVWNVDYIRLDRGRNFTDTAVRDVATTVNPSYLLNDYTSMPYNQFLANVNGELATQHSFEVRNNASTTESITYRFESREALTGTPLGSSSPNNATLPPYQNQTLVFPQFLPSFPSQGNDAQVIFEQTYTAQPSILGNVPQNDTIVRQQVFDNYLAYDDGTAEKSYFLNQFATLPALLAVEYHLNQPDTLFGLAIYFGRQVPLAFGKFFDVLVYDDIAANGGSDQLIYSQQILFPGYADTMNKFWYYKFDSPVPLSSGAFFVATRQPAASGSDSLYFGLDVNRVGGNHLYYNVQNFWESSLVSGAVMMRPIMNGNFTPSGIQDAAKNEVVHFTVTPNPAKDFISIILSSEQAKARYEVLDLQGITLHSGAHKAGASIDISDLQPGVYFIRVLSSDGSMGTQKIIKL